MIASEKDCRIKEDGSIVNENNRISDDEGYESDESCEGYDNNDDSSDGESDTDFVDFVNIVDDPNAKKGFDPMDISLLAKSITANPKFREWKMDEPFRRGTVLSTESIDLVMRTKKCPPFRKSEACVNGNCLDLLGSVSAARESVISLRSSFFQPKGTVSFRKGTLINKLREHIITDEDNRPHIQYMVQGSSKQVKVCKGFYRMASGVPKKMFDAIVSCVECTTTNHRIVDCCNK